MQDRAAQRRRRPEGKNPAGERHKHCFIHPLAQCGTLLPVAPLEPTNADLQFKHGDDGQMKKVRVDGSPPGGNVRVDPLLRLAQFRHDVRVENIHQEKSAGRMSGLSNRPGSKSTSASGIESCSTIDFLEPASRR